MQTVTRLIVVAVALGAPAAPVLAYIDRPPTLGRLVQYDAANIVVIRVEKVSKDKGVIIYQKAADLKGKYPDDRIKQRVSRRIADAPGPEDNPRPRGAHPILDWAEPGKLAVLFHDADHKVSAICVGPVWYLGWADQDGWWGVNEFEERGLSWAYVGSVEKLREHVAAIMDGKEVVVTAARYDGHGGGNRELWNNQTAYQNLARDAKVRVWRIRAGRDIVSLTDALTGRHDFVVGMGTGDRGAVPALVQALESKDPIARSQAADDLGQIGPEAESAVPDLAKALKDSTALVRVNAAEALWQIGRPAAATASALAESLKNGDVQVRRLVAEGLWRMGPEAKAAAPALADALQDADREVRRDAAEALWRIGPDANAAIPALVRALKDEDGNVRRSAAGALGTFGAGAKVAVPALTEVLKDKDLAVRHFAARALVQIGDPQARQAAAPVLREVLGVTPDQRVRAEIIVFLWRISPEPESTFPTLKDGAAGDVLAATQLLRKADGQTRENAVPTLVAALRGSKEDPSRRSRIIQVLGEIGPRAKTAVSALVGASQDKDENVRREAANALKKIQQE